MNAGKRLKELRSEKGYTQQYVADLLGITREAYSHYENDKREIGLDALDTLADLFDVSIDFLVGRTDEFGNKRKEE